jgi:ubiquinone biosynthesis protein
MDLRLEAAAAAEFAANCAADEGFRVPAVDWARTARRVVTFEWIDGLRADDVDTLRAAGIEPDRVMERAAVVFFNQVFRDGFFHADMHPGNMLIERDGTIVALDFGIMGRIDLAMRQSLAQILLGFVTRDYGLVADVFFRLGLVPAHQDRAAFTQACRALGEPILGRPLSDISVGRLLGQLLSTAESFEMTTQPQLMLLQKTMLVAEGVGRTLNPELNMWQVAEPLVQAWMRRHLGPEAMLRRRLAEAAEALGRLPGVVAALDARLAADRGPAGRAAPAERRWPTGLVAASVLLAFTLGLLLGCAPATG